METHGTLKMVVRLSNGKWYSNKFKITTLQKSIEFIRFAPSAEGKV